MVLPLYGIGALTHCRSRETELLFVAMRTSTTTDLESSYVHLRDDRSAEVIPVTASFWSELSTGKRPELESGRLVMQFSFDSDWRTWEMHPKGDEVVVLLSGSVDFVQLIDGEEKLSSLSQIGEYVLVPAGIWHTARVKDKCTMLFMTPGEGTENLESPPGK